MTEAAGWESMRLGLVHINMGPMSQPDALARAAHAAEAAGFDSVWAGEHVVLPDPQCGHVTGSRRIGNSLPG